MPKREDLKSILIIGSGPIVIGQACEFDYAGTQAVKALKEEGYKIILVNSNPATIMTDPGLGDRTYVEPIEYNMVAEIIRQERPDALLPTLGGQTALNLAMELHRSGLLKELGVEMIGASPDAIERAEDRQIFRQAMTEAGLDVPRSGFARSRDEALELSTNIGFPCIVRPSFTLGGTGGGTAYNRDELASIVDRGLSLSPIGEVMIEESLLGWKEIEIEVMRDCADNAIIICGIENFDPMGVHTGDSITVAPIQTLTDREYQDMRRDSFAIIRKVGVAAGGSNIQFAVDPKTGRRAVIEMNPRVSRSSALASKATGFPIARVAAKLAVGYRLDELTNDMTGATSACFEPAVDYHVIKVPRFVFDKFRGASTTLGTQMKSVGETLAVGRTFREALQKALRGLETGYAGFGADTRAETTPSESIRLNPQLRDQRLRAALREPTPWQLVQIHDALSRDMTVEEIYELTAIDPWFLDQLARLVAVEKEIGPALEELLSGKIDAAARPKAAETLRRFKREGFSDEQMAWLVSSQTFDKKYTATDIRRLREELGVFPAFKAVDTCAGEYQAAAPYYYSTYQSSPDEEGDDLWKKDDRPAMVILGGGPNRIGQGIEFDYCCVHAVNAARELGYAAVMVNCNPETVSTDFDLADRLYMEPLTLEDVLEVCRREKPVGVITQFGGQTPLNLAHDLAENGVKILGTPWEEIERAEDRDIFGKLLDDIGIPRPAGGAVANTEAACRLANSVGFPVIARPSFVLAGRAMRILYDEEELRDYMQKLSAERISVDRPVFIDRFLEEAVEVDVDAISDGAEVMVAAVMEHIEQAGIHSGDSCCVIPPRTLASDILETIRSATCRIAKELKVKGLINIQFAVYENKAFVLEANPRASRTVPFVAKATGMPLAGIALKLAAGKTIAELDVKETSLKGLYAVKEVVLPFDRFPGTPIILGPEMHSTGEVMGMDRIFGLAFMKAQIAAGTRIASKGDVILSVADEDKRQVGDLGRRIAALGYQLYATSGTRKVLEDEGVDSKPVLKIRDGRPNIRDMLVNDTVAMLINTLSGADSVRDITEMRSTALARRVPLISTMEAALAMIEGLEAMGRDAWSIRALQDCHATA